MAAGGDSSSKQTFSLPSRTELVITRDDIFKTSADALTTGEDCQLMGHGGVSEALLRTGPRAYRKAREEMKRKAKKVEAGTVLSCSFPSGTGSSCSFDTVYHVVVPNAHTVNGLSKWRDKMKELYGNLFREVDRDGKPSLALPLLGSGGAGASFEDAVGPLVDSLISFRPLTHRLRYITVYVRDQKAFKILLAAIENKLQQPQAKPVSQEKSRNPSCSSRSPPSHFSSSTSKKTARKSRTVSRSPSSEQSQVTNTVTDSPDEDSNLSVILGQTTLDAQIASRNAFPAPDIEEQISRLSINSSSEEEEEEEKEEDADDDATGDINGREEDSEDDKCPICLDVMEDPKKLDKCRHVFCRECIEDSFRHHKPVCPTCGTVYGIILGNQPPGTMSVSRIGQQLPGYKNCGAIVIDYSFLPGTQGKEHPNPGQLYSGTRRRAFLPDSAEGQKVCRLLRVAFDNRLTFTVGRSRTTGADNVVTWNDIHHKTSIDGGPTGFGYPDPQYLARVQEELAARGITEDCLKDPLHRVDL